MISVVVPALNEEKFLPACLESLRNQDYGDEYEVIVADNGSSDSTADIARSQGVRVIACLKKKGVIYARQAGADAAYGDIIVQADADTVYPGDWLKKIAAQFAAHPGAAAVAGIYIYKDPPSWAGLEYFLRNILNRITIALFGRPMLISGATFAFRRRVFQIGNGYQALSYYPDQYGISSRLSRNGRVLYDKSLRVLTSSRSVQRPFLFILKDVVANIRKLGIYFGKSCLSSLHEFTVKTPSRRIAAWSSPVLVLIILFNVFASVIPSAQAFGKVYYEGDSSEKVIALTFGDAPNEPYTSEILDILSSYNVTATFFVVGENVELYPEIARRIIAEGHVIGNHSYSHDISDRLTEYDSDSLKTAQEIIFSAVGVRPHLYRPPNGIKTPWELESARELGMITITWSVSIDEWDEEAVLDEPSLEMAISDIVAKVEPGDIIRVYDGYGTNHGDAMSDRSITLEALPIIIGQLQDKGYRFVTVPELLDVPSYIEQAFR